MSALSLLKAIYSKPYAVIFIAAAALSAHGLFIAAHQLGHITAWIAWAYVLIVTCSPFPPIGHGAALACATGPA
jgi:hypothetical protein